jgi:hypothetical protein
VFIEAPSLKALFLFSLVSGRPHYREVGGVHMLVERDLVDELRLTVFPVALGAGQRLFGETSDKRPLRLVQAKTVGSGLAHLTYERARE